MIRLASWLVIPAAFLNLMPAPLAADELTVSTGKLNRAAEEFECDDPTSFLCFLEGNVLCTQGGRFRVQVEWRDFEGNSGQAQSKKLTPNSGYFWFFDPDNAEIYVKVLDGRQVNGHYWVFFGSASNVEFKVCVTDIFAREQRVYENPLGEFASIGDAVAFRSLGVCGTIAGLTCPEGDVCELPSGQCQSADLAGSCVERPEACIEIFDPVRGCDGMTYSNDCHRLMAGVALDHVGECKPGVSE